MPSKTKAEEPTTAEDVLAALVPNLAEDVLMALRYHYYVKAHGLIPDQMYDAAEKDFLARSDTDQFSTPINLPGSDQKESYPDHVMALALYLAFAEKSMLEARYRAQQRKK